MIKSTMMLLGFFSVLMLTQSSSGQMSAATTAGPAKEELIGQVQEIAPDGSYIIIDGIKVGTNKDFIDDNVIELGDVLKLTAEKKGEKRTAVSSEFIFDFGKGEDNFTAYGDEQSDYDADYTYGDEQFNSEEQDQDYRGYGNEGENWPRAQ